MREEEEEEERRGDSGEAASAGKQDRAPPAKGKNKEGRSLLRRDFVRGNYHTKTLPGHWRGAGFSEGRFTVWDSRQAVSPPVFFARVSTL